MFFFIPVISPPQNLLQSCTGFWVFFLPIIRTYVIPSFGDVWKRDHTAKMLIQDVFDFTSFSWLYESQTMFLLVIEIS